MGIEPAVPTFSVKPEVVALEELFEEIKSGHLRIPRFHRPFVWQPEDMRRLFASVIKGYPIGSLVIWEPGARIELRSHFGPLDQREPSPGETDLAYVVDGQHRLATLFGATHVIGEPSGDAASQRWWMWYDLEAEEFTHTPQGGVGPAHLPLRNLLATTQFLRFCENLLKARPDEGPRLVERAERLLRLVRVYKLPVVRIRGGKLEDAVDIFSRLNSSGVQVAADQG